MTEQPAEAVFFEKTLYQYTSAVERGDFETVAAILAQAEGDPRLEQMIVEINAALAAELPPAPRLTTRTRAADWQRLRAALHRLAPGVGLSALVLVVVAGMVTLIGPAIGNTFVEVASLPTADYSRYRLDKAPSNSQAVPSYLQSYPAVEPTANFHFARPTTAAAAAMGLATSYPGPEVLFVVQATPTPLATRPAGVSAATIPANQPRMVARSGYLAMTVADTRGARNTISEIVSGYAAEGAFIVSSDEHGISGSDQPAIFMRLRVPVDRYDAVMNRLVGLALTVDARQEQADDVTAEYVDAQARIRELETAIERLLEIARTAENTEDLLTMERALGERRAELEAMKGRAQYLSQTAALSLIQVELRPKIIYPTMTPTSIPTPEAWRPEDTAQRSTLVLLRDLRRFGDWLIVFGITTLPWVLAVGLVGFAGYRMWRRGRK